LPISKKDRIMKRQKTFLLPNLFTLINLFFGYLSILSSFHGKYFTAAFLIIFAAVMDGFDGIAARMTKTHSELGVQLDSLADVISFGVAPSILLYFWGFNLANLPRTDIFFSFIFLSAGVLRLARYNTIQKNMIDRKFYTGLTIPSASLLIAAIVLNHPAPITIKPHAFLLAVLIVILSLFMVSTIKYRNFLNFNFRKRIDLKTAFLVAIILSSLILYPRIFILSYSFLNVLYGPIIHLFKRLKKKAQEELEEVEAEVH